MKTRLCVAGALATAWTLGAACAADLPRPMYTKAPPPLAPLMYNWTGFYAGVNVGGSWGHQDTTLASGAVAVTNANHIDGVIGGAQVGYNWQGLGSPWVFGLEADIQGSGQKTDNAFAIATIPPAAIAYEDNLDWFGTVRGRVGYAVGDQGRWLPYVTGGLAYGESKFSGSGAVGGLPVAFSQTNTNVGWTVGAGLEWAFWDKWSAKIEYLYMDLGNGSTIALTPTSAVSTGRMTDNVARVGVNFHF
ncbi:MAG TPA: outer membrane protein [Xanthobacteraceae bacterium]|nr:outer membrane protein [Xanthobacteraceae bacterium]